MSQFKPSQESWQSQQPHPQSLPQRGQVVPPSQPFSPPSQWQQLPQSHTPPPIKQPPPLPPKPRKSQGKAIVWLIVGIFIGLSIGYPIGHNTAYAYIASPTSRQTAVANDQPKPDTPQPTSQSTTATQLTTFS